MFGRLCNELIRVASKVATICFVFFVQQRHHFAQAIAILNTHGCNIFEKFSRKVKSV